MAHIGELGELKLPEHEERFWFIANRLWLDFLNTELVSECGRVSLINSPADLREWLRAAGMIAGSCERGDLPERASQEALLKRALEFREVLRGMAGNITAGRPVPPGVPEEINRLLEAQKCYEALLYTRDRYVLETRCEQAAEGLLAPVARSAAELLANEDLSRLRRCANPQCPFYFYDTSKNRSRRWCSMEMCGNRCKQAAHYRRICGRRASAGCEPE